MKCAKAIISRNEQLSLLCFRQELATISLQVNILSLNLVNGKREASLLFLRKRKIRETTGCFPVPGKIMGQILLHAVLSKVHARQGSDGTASMGSPGADHALPICWLSVMVTASVDRIHLLEFLHSLRYGPTSHSYLYIGETWI